MGITIPTPWTELLSQKFGDVSDKYGPHSQFVASACATLARTRWLSRQGEPIANERVMVVASWEDAIAIFEEAPRYNVAGVLRGAYASIDQVLERNPELWAWWSKAREDASDYGPMDGVPKTSPREERDRVYAYLNESVSMLLAEIVVADYVGSTYFREQLAWFHAGHFPCGWDGDWPVGRMRVY